MLSITKDLARTIYSPYPRRKHSDVQNYVSITVGRAGGARVKDACTADRPTDKGGWSSVLTLFSPREAQ